MANSLFPRMAKIVPVKLPEPVISSGEEEEEEEEICEDNFPPAWQGYTNELLLSCK